ncbi:MAG TPA: ASKHA domain-containing protein [Clostridia bacterium]|nr:ASKHA domain-containing protein [Clostridia bacterium]
MQHRIKLHMNDTEKTIIAEEGTDLLRLLQSSGVPMNTPCAGKGTCGKCAVRVEGALPPPSDREKTLLGAAKLEKGHRLACYTHISSVLDVYPEEGMREASIITSCRIRDFSLQPMVQKHYIELDPPSLEDQRPDLERVLEVLGLYMPGNADGMISEPSNTPAHSELLADPFGLDLIKKLPGVLKASGYKITAVMADGRLLGVESGDTTGRLFGIAVDIGTTTVAAYLFDLGSGKCVSTASTLNPQRKYGADVISRIDHSSRSGGNRSEQQDLITGCIDELSGKMAKDAEISTNDIYAAVFAGNTTMLHLLLGLDASGIAAAPFIPVTTGLVRTTPKDLGLSFNRYGTVAVFPGVSAYIGGDIVAAILSSGIYEKEGISLLVDIGTNGEIVLGGREWLLACSAAAGPAFEGANIRNGMGGVAGAIDSVGSAPDFDYTVIGNTKPAGICGSGIVDVLAALLDAELLDETGRLPDTGEAEASVRASDRASDKASDRALDKPLNAPDKASDKPANMVSDRLIDIDGSRAFLLCGSGKKGTDYTGEPIVITQRDIREIQNAKAAIAAGIETLIMEAGITHDDIGKVYLAGGFGSSLHIDTAVRVGLLPKVLEDKVEAIGNASAAGAAEGLLSETGMAAAAKLAKRVKYVELSASARFTEKYVENMLF